VATAFAAWREAQAALTEAIGVSTADRLRELPRELKF
jgi:hypothetical protein